MFTKRSTSGFFMVLAVFNLIVAVIPPAVGAIGAYQTISPTDLKIKDGLGNERQVGPEIDKLIAQEAPMAKIEAFTAVSVNALSCLILIIGSVCLFMGLTLGRWVTVAGALFMIMSLFVHDVYQIFFYRPALMNVIDRIAAPVPLLIPPGGLPPQADQARRNMENARDVGVGVTKWAVTMYTLAWSCTNPLFMLYFFVMMLCMAFMTGFYDSGGIEKDGVKPALRGEDDDEDDEDEDEDEDDRRRARKKRKNRGDDEED